jgi:tRNA modification GTPase
MSDSNRFSGKIPVKIKDLQMEFTQMPYRPGETIAAIASPPGDGGVAVIRITGNEAVEVAGKIFTGDVSGYRSHTAHYGNIIDREGTRIDDVLLMPMRGKRSYSGEDTVEIFCHGGALITRRVLDRVLEAGARQALPGEFTFKAFVNGKLDLAQAEAVQELIGARNEKALQAAEKQLEGALSTKVRGFQERLTLMAAILEAWVDFPDEGLEFISMEEIIRQLVELKDELQELVDSFHDGKILHDGLSLCLIGAPNVGKSSLMNALLDKERAIVSAIAGTTRDLLEDQMRLAGLNFKVLDTAGIRETEEEIEQEGIRRSKKAMNEADLVLLVLDVQHPDLPAFWKELPPEKTIVVWNKCDLSKPGHHTLSFPHVCAVSALKRTGLKELKQEIEKVIWKKGPPSKEEVIVTNVRHHEALKEAVRGIQAVVDGLNSGVSPEFIALEMREALFALGKVIGTNVSEDILSSIFSTFCIGK